MQELLPRPQTATLAVSLVLGIPFLVGLALLTLWPAPVEDTAPGFLDLVLRVLREDLSWWWLGFDQLEVIANVLVFVPVGILAFLFIPRRFWALALVAGPLLSLAIETVQWRVLPERAATFADVVANSAGATFGVGLALLCTVISAARPVPHPSPTLEAS